MQQQVGRPVEIADFFVRGKRSQPADKNRHFQLYRLY
jgi:hypothetical protein